MSLTLEYSSGDTKPRRPWGPRLPCEAPLYASVSSTCTSPPDATSSAKAGLHALGSLQQANSTRSSLARLVQTAPIDGSGPFTPYVSFVDDLAPTNRESTQWTPFASSVKSTESLNPYVWQPRNASGHRLPSAPRSTRVRDRAEAREPSEAWRKLRLPCRSSAQHRRNSPPTGVTRRASPSRSRSDALSLTLGIATKRR